MTRANVSRTWLAIAALVLGTSACVATVDGASEDDVAVVEEALGGYTHLVSTGATPMDVGPTYTVFVAPPIASECDEVFVFMTQTGGRVTVQALPGCPGITAATSQSGVFVADNVAGKIYRLVDADGLRWAPFVTTTDWVGRMFNNSTHLFWHGADKLHKVSLATGLESSGPFTLDGDVLGLEGSTVYANVFTNSKHELRKYFWSTASPHLGIVARNAKPFWSEFSFDANHFYWAENSGVFATNKIMKVAKDAVEASGSTVKSSSAVQYYVPRSNGSALYWLEKPVVFPGAPPPGPIRLRRMNLANGNHVSADFPFNWAASDSSFNVMRLLSNGLFFTPRAGSPSIWSLYRTPL